MTHDVAATIDHLFRCEAGKMVSYLARVLGLSRLDLAEDIVQEALCRALDLWPVHGIPENPSAWLMRVARNRAIDVARREGLFRHQEPDLTQGLADQSHSPEHVAVFEREIRDDQLRMMFACCHPELSTEAQVVLILKTLCGFSVAEIGHALLSSVESVEKRLSRARNLFRESVADWRDSTATEERLEAVYRAIYLLFNEGYHASASEQKVREDLCSDAIRLALLLSEPPVGNKPKTHALVSLLCFHAARLPGRTGNGGDLLQLDRQDRATWDQALVARGFHHFGEAATGTELSEYHLEAAIASLHSAAPSYDATDWRQIRAFYDRLYELKPTPIVALNRAIAYGNAEGPEAGLRELRAMREPATLKEYPFYPAAHGEFHLLAGRPRDAAKHFSSALKLARSPGEAEFFEGRLKACWAG